MLQCSCLSYNKLVIVDNNMWRHLDGAKRSPHGKPTAVSKSVRDTAYDQTKRMRKFQQHWTNDYPWLENGENSMHCNARRNNGDFADNSSRYVRESGCTNFTLKSVKSHADNKQHRKVEYTGVIFKTRSECHSLSQFLRGTVQIK